MPQIYSQRRYADPIPNDAILVDRTTPWGNPFPCNFESADPSHLHGRAWAVKEFRKYAEARLEREPNWLEDLRGHDLVCWCQCPSDAVKKACHAEVLLELANITKETTNAGR